MQLHSVAFPSRCFVQNPTLQCFSRPSVSLGRTSCVRYSVFLQKVGGISVSNNESRLTTGWGRSGRGFVVGVNGGIGEGDVASISTPVGGDVGEVIGFKRKELVNRGIWKQMQEILMFSGPATGVWICAPLMSLLSTAVVGRGSSIELSALGLATVLCDNMNLLFAFLSISTSNMVATALAKQDEIEAQHQISILLFVGLTFGILMLLFTQFLSSQALSAFAGPKNVHIVPVATKYVQIRGLAWPAVLYGLIAQSASLGMKNSSGPLKALIVAIIVNGIGHLLLCSFLGYGIKGAAFSTMASQIIAAYMMTEALSRKGYNAFEISVPSPVEFQKIVEIAAPVFVSVFSKVAFYSLLTYCATSMGTYTGAAHQVMSQTFAMFVVWGEPLSQSAQSFMPELLCGVKQNLTQARILWKSLVIIGAILGTAIGAIGMSIPWFFPYMFTRDINVIQEMHKVLILFFLALWVSPCTHSLEGTLLAGRELSYISFAMFGCLCAATMLLLLVRGHGLAGCWFALVGFQWARFLVALIRLLSPAGILSKK